MLFDCRHEWNTAALIFKARSIYLVSGWGKRCTVHVFQIWEMYGPVLSGLKYTSSLIFFWIQIQRTRKLSFPTGCNRNTRYASCSKKKALSESLASRYAHVILFNSYSPFQAQNLLKKLTKRKQGFHRIFRNISVTLLAHSLIHRVQLN